MATTQHDLTHFTVISVVRQSEKKVRLPYRQKIDFDRGIAAKKIGLLLTSIIIIEAAPL